MARASRGQQAARIVVVTPNPAIDITYEVPRPQLGATNRVGAVTRRPGGKGINVASVLVQLAGIRGADGAPRLRLTGFLGGGQGRELREGLEGWDLEQRWLDLGEDYHTRATVLVRDEQGEATGFYEPGCSVPAGAWERLKSTALDAVGPGDVLVVSGSCPPGTRAQDLCGMLRAARDRGARTIVDTSGPLLRSCAAHADVVKPNHDELAEATGAAGVTAGARRLARAGARAVVVSDGPQGMYLFAGADRPRTWHAPAPSVPVINPTGAGDAAVAALAAFMADHPGVDPIDDGALVGAVALSVAAVRTPVAGLVDLETYLSILPTVKADRTDATD